MGVEIDRLEVQVEAQAQKANSQLESLVGKLDRVCNSLMRVNGSGLTGLSNGVSKFVQAAGGLSNVKTADFTRLTKNIASLSALNAQQLYGASSAISTLGKSINSLQGVSCSSMQVAEMAKNISKLGGVNVQRAITNLPQLATALNNLMITLSKSPVVSRDIIQMTNALAELASQGGKVGTAANTVSNSLNTQSRSAERATKSTKTLASAIGSLYQKYFLIMRVIPKAWSSVESSMDFLETVNYFEVAMRKIGDDAVKTWDGLGYASAEAYAESFSERLKQLTTKMTGFDVDENGNAKYTGTKNLGMNPDDVMQWQAVYAQMADSLGIAEESTLHFSKALTMLGGDWASLRNLSFDTAWNKFASALAGQSRAVRSLGIDITNATLQEYAYKYGLEQAVQEMNQATKAQLRLLAILDQSKVAYGDLANTIGSPSNQIRMLTQNMDNLGRVIGNLFLPIVQTTLPYINGFVIALQNMFAWVGNLFGIKFDPINSSMGGMDDTMADLVGGADDFGSALDDANKSAKKLNKTLQPWHEINNITTQDKSSAGATGGIGGSAMLDDEILKALDEYEKKWNEAFENMDNKAQEFAEKFGEHFEIVRDIIEDFVVGDYFKAGQDTSKLVAGIFNFFADAIDNVDWEEIGENIGDYLAGLDWIKILGSFGHLVWEALKAGFELWHGAFSEAPFEMTLVTLMAMPKALKAITATKFVTGITKLAKKFGVLGKSANSFLQNLDATGQIFTFNTGIEAIRSKLTGLQKGVIGTTAVIGEFFLLEDGFYDIAKGSDNLVASLGQIVVGAGVAVGALKLIGLSNPWTAAIVGITAVVSAIVGINKAIDDMQIETMFNSLKENGEVSLVELQDTFSNFVTEISNESDIAKEKLSSISESRASIEETADSIGLIVTAVENGGYELDAKIPEIIDKFEELLSETKRIFEEEYDVIVGNVCGAYADILTAQGQSVPELVQGFASLKDEAVSAYSDLEKQAKSLEEQYESGAISGDVFFDKYVPIMQKIKDFNSNGEVDNATSAMEKFYGALHMSDYIDGTTFNISEFRSDIEQFAQAADNGRTSITTFGEESMKTFNDFMATMESLGVDTDKYSEDILAVMGANDEYVEKNVGVIESAYQQYMDIIQYDLLEQLPSIVEDATAEYDKLNPLKKIFTTKEDYVQGVVDEWRNNVLAPASKEIENGFNKLGIDGSVWCDDAARKLINSIFDNMTEYSYEGVEITTTTLKKDWKSILKNSLSGASEAIDSESYGKDTVDGYVKGVEDNVQTSSDAIQKWMEEVDKNIHDSALDFGSPSKRTEEYAKWTVEGFNKGIEKNTDSTVVTIQKYIGNVVSAFDGIAVKMSTIGTQTMQGFLDGMDSMSDKVAEKAQGIADSVAKTVQSALDIHSPSRVMFSLGEYTVEGFNLGVENMFENFKKSFGQYTANSVDYLSTGMYTADYRSALGRESVVNNEYISNYGSQNDMYETNMLLRELVTAVRQGSTIVIDGEPVFKVTRNRAKEFYDRTGYAPYPV